MKCPNPACGREIADTAAFCSYCGTRVHPETPVVHRPEQVPAGDADAHRRASRNAAPDGRSTTDRSAGGMGTVSDSSSQRRYVDTRKKPVWDNRNTLFWKHIKGFATASLVFTALLFLVPAASFPWVGGVSLIDALLTVFRIASIPEVSSYIGTSTDLSNAMGGLVFLALVGVLMLACSIRGCRLAWSGIAMGADLGVRFNGVLGLIILFAGLAAGATGIFLMCAFAHVVMWGLMMGAYFQEGLHGFKDNMR